MVDGLWLYILGGKMITRKYYKYVDTVWSQPTLTSNNVINKDSFAVKAINEHAQNAGYFAYFCFSSSSNTNEQYTWQTTQIPAEYTIYSETPIKITNIQITNRCAYARAMATGNVYGSLDSGTWVLLGTFTNTNNNNGAIWNIPLDNNSFYKYYKISNITSLDSTMVGIGKITLTAYTQGVVESTSDDYDFYKDILTAAKTKRGVTRKYYKYDIKDFVQPTLTSNGLLGGSYFACGGQARNGIYAAFDNNASTYAQFGTYSGANNLIFYNPNPLKISSLSFQDYSGAQWNNGKLEYSDDGYTWTLSNNNITNSAVNWSFNVSEQGYHKYWKLTVTAAAGYNGSNWDWTIWDCYQLNINAKEKTIVEGTSSDYDFYKDVPTYYPYKIDKRNYYSYKEVDWYQPILTSNGTPDTDEMAIENVDCPTAPWTAFDGNPGTTFNINNLNPNYKSFILIFREKIKLTKLQFTAFFSSSVSGGPGFTIIEGSNDKETWVELGRNDNMNRGDAQITTVDLNPTNYYKYYRIQLRHGSVSANYWGNLREIRLSGKHLVSALSTTGTYDYYQDITIYKAI